MDKSRGIGAGRTGCNAPLGVLAETGLNRLGKTYGCGVEVSLAVLGGKWKPVILARLKEQPMTYGDLRRALPSLSDKVLTERLKQLEEQGLAMRDAAYGVTSDVCRQVSLRAAGSLRCTSTSGAVSCAQASCSA